MNSEDWRARKRRVDVLGRALAVVDRGDPDAARTFVLLHGNPTSSFLWRDVAGPLEGLGRVVAPDLLGMGDSDKLADSGPGSYRFAAHAAHLEALLAGLGVTGGVVLVGHDWGGALGFDWARRHADAVAGIAYMETIVRPFASWDEWVPAGVGMFQALRSPAGEGLVLDRNLFVERILPASVLRPLAPEVLDEYRRPFAEPGEGRRPMLTWPREIPIAGEPADVVAVAGAYSEWLATTAVPKLFVNAEPGSMIGAQRTFCRSLPQQTEVTVAASHFVPEDAGPELGEVIAGWAGNL